MRSVRLLSERRDRHMRKTMAAALLALATIPAAAGVATAREANPLADSNVVERVECLVRVYVTEGGEQGLDCLV